MTADYQVLSPEQRRHVDAAIATARQSGRDGRFMVGGDEYYAYPHDHGVAWGIASQAAGGFNIARGVMPNERGRMR